MAIRRESLHAPTFGRYRRDLPRSAGPAYVASLVSEAHRLARRRALIEAACRQPVVQGGAGRPLSEARRSRLTKRGSRLMLDFHAVLDRLFAADRFEDALAAFRAYRSGREHYRDSAMLIRPPMEPANGTCPVLGWPPNRRRPG